MFQWTWELYFSKSRIATDQLERRQQHQQEVVNNGERRQQPASDVNNVTNGIEGLPLGKKN